jgi:hypothetical protein
MITIPVPVVYQIGHVVTQNHSIVLFNAWVIKLPSLRPASGVRPTLFKKVQKETTP